jgi:hypothetical protein
MIQAFVYISDQPVQHSTLAQRWINTGRMPSLVWLHASAASTCTATQRHWGTIRDIYEYFYNDL